MSFILDALKKSEAARSRQTGPTLIDMRFAPQQRKLPLWVIVIGAVLITNLAVLAFVVLRGKPESAAPVIAPVVDQSAPAVTPAAPATMLPAANAVLPEPTLVERPTADDLPAVAPRVPIDAAAEGTEAFLPSAQELVAAGVSLPAMQLSLHVYDSVPANRYVLLNASRLHEGETTPDGLVLTSVTPTGVILTWRTRRFTLRSGGSP